MIYRSIFLGVFVVILLSFSACEKRAPDQIPAPQVEEGEPAAEIIAFPRNDWDCTQENARRIRSWVGEYEGRHGNRMLVPTSVALGLVEQSGELPTRPLVIAEVREGQVLVEGQSSKELEALPILVSERLRMLRAKAEIMGEDYEGWALALAFAADMRQERVAATIDLLDGAEGVDFSEVYLAFLAPHVPERVEEIPAELWVRMREDFPRDPPKERQETLSEDRDGGVGASFLERCPALGPVVDELEKLQPQERAAHLGRGVSEVWLECDCNFDLEYFVALKMGGAAKHDEEHRYITFVKTSFDALRDSAEGERGLTWAELVQKGL